MTELSLFDPPRIETPPPSALGSESSRRASVDVSSPFRRESWRRILLTLAASSTPLSREELSLATDLPINVVTARVSELFGVWIEKSGDRQSRAKPGLKVDGLTLTAAGRARCAASGVGP